MILKNLIFCIPNAIRNIGKGKPPPVETTILHGISGVFRPRRITLVLGQPGSGKSTLFRALSGSLKSDASQRVSGTTMFGHLNMSKVHRGNFVTMVQQIDVHHSTLTTRETLDFARRCRQYHVEKYNTRLSDNVRNQMDLRAFKKLAGQQTNMNLAMLGLIRCGDTVVGDENLKGISGGEKRRVTLGEMLISRTRVQLLDEISTGLDSASTLDIIKALKAQSRIFNTTPVISLLQPPPETFVEFDDLLLLDSGRIVYFGPRAEAMNWFEELGYRCPESKDPADFLQEVTTRGNEIYLFPAEELTERGIVPPKTSKEFAGAFAQSKYCTDMDAIIKEQIASERPAPTSNIETGLDLIANMGRYRRPTFELFTILLARQIKLLVRNKVYIRAHIFSNFLLGTVFGLVYWQMEETLTSGLSKVVLIFNVIQNLSIASFQMIPTIMNARQIYYKQKNEDFFPPTAYIVADILAFAPITVIDVFTYGTIVYWMTGMASDVAAYFNWIGILIGFGLYAAMSTRALCFFLPNLNAASGMLVLLMVLFILTSGVLVNPSLITQSWLVWMYWANPFAYTLRGLLIDQLTSGNFAKQCPGSGNETCGMAVLELQGFPTETSWVGKAYLFNIGIIFFFGLVAAFSLSYIEHTSEGGDGSDENDDELKATERSDDFTVPVDHDALKSVPFTEYNIAFQNLTYTIDLVSDNRSASLDILKNISGKAEPGQMTALMGSSGAGKTTLLDVLAGRKTTGRIVGDICINGRPKDEGLFRRIAGYVEQFPSLPDTETVKECMDFAARLRLPATCTQAQRAAIVNNTINILELKPILHRVVGTLGVSGLSFEEMKRVSIGVEMVANPSILFCDEPTSGLDARAAMFVMRGLSKIAQSGRTVICTIHQPSRAIFEMFHSLLLMKRGGEIVFFGPLGEQSQNLIKHLESIPGTVPCPKMYNPATWMLEVIGAGVGGGGGKRVDVSEYVAAYRDSEMGEENEIAVAEMCVTPIGDLPSDNGARCKYATSFGVQFKELHARFS